MTRGVELRRKSAQAKKEELARKKKVNSEEYISEFLMVHPAKPIPADTYDKDIMPKMTKTSAMRTGLNFADLAVSVHTLKWAVPPKLLGIVQQEPYTKVGTDV